VMKVWDTVALDEQPPHIREFAEIWRAADKIVYSTTLDAVSSPRTRIERQFDPEDVWRLKADAERDLTVAGPQLASHAFGAGLIDEVQLVLAPVVVGGGKPAIPAGVRAELETVDVRRFGNGMVHLRYLTRGPT
jgi:dihydrofolate reductase